MTPLELVREDGGKEFRSEDGEPLSLKLLPGLSASEIAAFESILPCPLLSGIRDLLGFCRGFDDLLESVDFTGLLDGFEFPDAFPYRLPIAHDGYGNYWVVDLLPTSRLFGTKGLLEPVFVFPGEAVEIMMKDSVEGGSLGPPGAVSGSCPTAPPSWPSRGWFPEV